MNLHPFYFSLHDGSLWTACVLVTWAHRTHVIPPSVQSGGQMTEAGRSRSPVTSFCKENFFLWFDISLCVPFMTERCNLTVWRTNFPSSCFVYSRRTFNGGCEQDIMRAGREWESDSFSAGEESDLWFKMCRDMRLNFLIYLAHKCSLPDSCAEY